MNISGTGGTGVSALHDEVFRRVDQDGDGRIGRKEFLDGAPQGPRGARSTNLDELFSRIDGNDDGVIDEAEHNRALQTLGPHTKERATPGELAKQLFEKADGDRDGKVTAAELRSAAPPESSDSMLDALFKEADKDDDGTISLQELEASLSRRIADVTMAYSQRREPHRSGGSGFTDVA